MSDNPNQTNAQAILVSQTTLNPNQTTEELALFTQDGSPFDGSPNWGNGQIYVTTPAATTLTDLVTPVEAAGTWTLTDPASAWDQSGGAGRLTYIGAPAKTCFVSASISVTVAGVNDLIHLYLGVNGVVDPASEIQNKLASGGDVVSLSLNLISEITTGDYVSLFVRNETATDNVTVEAGNIHVISTSAI